MLGHNPQTIRLSCLHRLLFSEILTPPPVDTVVDGGGEPNFADYSLEFQIGIGTNWY